MDEPLANLDINTQIRVLNDLKDLCKSIKNPIAVILSSQNIEEVEAVSDNMIVLKAGEIKYYGKTINIGDNRKMNIYEFKCINSYEDLTEKFKNLSYINLDHNGFSYFITTPLNVSEINFLEHCTKEKIFLQLFQNISSSTKKIIVQTNIG